jgi:hypothetical protein
MENNREERIRQRAFELWYLSGCPHGRDLEHWSEASRQIEDEDARAGARLLQQIRAQRQPSAEAA